ncbi:uncharacterized protein LOC118189566 isoform X2 [Stegodyphus dumicola]|uniref:uncharacterized protein LOC118189566 isoform X2 n=1 Tax=Stegodyphus dumicola TaxID=202533 RepID=UPI0015ABD9AE|nr:uncharacterized protein LOC118189566 isoform X2 [Stegodyphus dumicola]
MARLWLQRPVAASELAPSCQRTRQHTIFLRLLLLFLAMCPASARPLPTTTRKPRWINPCDLQGQVYDPETDVKGEHDMAQIYSFVKESARIAKQHASNVKENFLKFYYYDSDYVSGTQDLNQNWLPKIPPTNMSVFRAITAITLDNISENLELAWTSRRPSLVANQKTKNTSKEEAFLKSFEFLQFFAVGIERIILDQLFHGGQFVNAFREVENHLTQLLCELQLGLSSLNVRPSRDVLRDVMNEKYRDVPSHSQRVTRDYIILRDYIVATDFVEKLFEYRLDRTL